MNGIVKISGLDHSPAATVHDRATPVPGGSLVEALLRLLGANALDPRWAVLQRAHQDKSIARWAFESALSGPIVFIAALFIFGQAGDIPVQLYIGTAIFLASSVAGLVFLPGMPWRRSTHRDTLPNNFITYAIMPGLALGWAFFNYATIVYLPEEWSELAVAIAVAIICLCGIGNSSRPPVALTSMSVVVVGGLWAIRDSGQSFMGVWTGGVIVLVALLHVAFSRFARAALGRVKGTAELELNERERRTVIELQHQAEKELMEAREAQLKEQEARREEADQNRRQVLLNLAAQFEASIGEVSNSVVAAAEQLNISARSLAEAAESAVSETKQVAEAMETVAAGTTAAASASDELAGSIQKISRQAAGSAELARRTNAAAMATDATVSNLIDRAQGIGEIAELIDNIARRTDLLALNASIEAARGGDAGRGFAVVASEVKDLANQTSRATGDVTDSINEIQDQSRASAKDLRKICEKIARLEAAAISIASVVDANSIAGKELAASVDLAANGAGDVSEATNRLRNAADLAGSASGQFLEASDHIKQQAVLLNRKVAGFLSEIRSEQSHGRP